METNKLELNLVVNARECSPAAISKGMLVNVTLELVDSTGKVMFTLDDGTVRMNRNDGSFFLAPPSKAVPSQGQTKYYRYWRVFPNDRPAQEGAEKWVLSEVEKKVGPIANIAAKSQKSQQQSGGGGGTFGAGTSEVQQTTPAPFTPAGGSAPEPAPDATKPAATPSDSSDFPFGGG